MMGVKLYVVAKRVRNISVQSAEKWTIVVLVKMNTAENVDLPILVKVMNATVNTARTAFDDVVVVR